MPSNKSLVLIALMAMLAWLVSTSLFVVSEQQRGIQRRFEHIVNGDLAPGLHIKLPIVDKVSLFDKRVQSSTLDSRTLVLASGEEILADIVANWQVDSPERYDSARQADAGKVAHDLMQVVSTQLTEQMSHLTLMDLASSRQDQALQAARNALNSRVQESLGVTITGLSFRRITLPEAQQAAVEQKMVTQWEHDASVTTTEGQDAADQRRADAERSKAMILAAAHENVETAKWMADAEVAARYNDAFTRNPAFFRFYQGLKTWQEGMQHSNGVLVLGPEDDLMRWIKSGR